MINERSAELKLITEAILNEVSAVHGSITRDDLTRLHLFTYLYFEGLSLHSNEPEWEGRDRLIVQGGKQLPMLYAVLARKGLMKATDSTYPGFAVNNSTPSELLALALRTARKAVEDEQNYRTYVLLEGQETDTDMMMKTAKTICQEKQYGICAITQNSDLAEPYAAVGFHVVVCNPDSFDSIEYAYHNAIHIRKPTLIVMQPKNNEHAETA